MIDRNTIPDPRVSELGYHHHTIPFDYALFARRLCCFVAVHALQVYQPQQQPIQQQPIMQQQPVMQQTVPTYVSQPQFVEQQQQFIQAAAPMPMQMPQQEPM